eukprot:s2674_g8.t1
MSREHMRGPEHALSLRSSIAFEPCRAHSHQVHEVQIVFAFDSNSSRSFRSHFRQGPWRRMRQEMRPWPSRPVWHKAPAPIKKLSWTIPRLGRGGAA